MIRCTSSFAVLLLVLCITLVIVVPSSNARRSIDFRLVKHPHRTFAQTVSRFQMALTRANPSYDYPMDGNVYPVGIYWTKIALGTPPQYFQVAVDSGSSDLLVPAITCQGCHSQNTGSYNPMTSTTSRTIACTNSTYRCAQCESGVCNFNNAYETCNLTDPTQPCTVKGPLYSDMFTMAPLSASVPFGAITFQSSNFQQFFVIDGVMGMAFDAGSSFRGTSPFQSLVNAGEVTDEFAMCLNSTSGGILTLGTPNMQYTTGAFQYTPLLSSLGQYILYVVRMKDVTVNGKSIGVSSGVYSRNSLGGCVVDSGTNILLLPSAAYKGIQTTMTSILCPNFAAPGVCSGNLIFDGYCYNYTPAQIASFPPLGIVLDGVTLNMKPTDYIVNNGTAGVYCLGIKNTGVVGITIIGDTTMQEYYVHFDRQNKRLGWAPVNAAACT